MYKLSYFKTCSIILLLTCGFQVLYAEVNSLSAEYTNAISNPERFKSDLDMDHKRKPSIVLPFSEVKVGDTVLELGAGGGYTTELLARVVGKTGKVYAHRLFNTKRLENNRLPNIISLRDHSLFELNEVMKENNVKKQSLDAIVIFFILHDIYLNNEMNKSVFNAFTSYLKPGGVVVVLDNSADDDSGLSSTEALHRIGKNFVIEEFEKAGFVVDGTSDALENKKDDHTKPWGDFKGEQDRFAIRFRKAIK
jgi:predicted methyltransferase